MRIIITPNNQKIVVNENASAGTLAKHSALAGNIGKTSILEMLRGQRSEAKGYKIIECERPKVANKIGVETVGTGKMRQRQPMKIYIKPLADRGLTDRVKGDFRRFLVACYHHVNASESGSVEYGKVGAALGGWSRSMVSVYAARARTLGYIDTIRESGKIGKEV